MHVFPVLHSTFWFPVERWLYVAGFQLLHPSAVHVPNYAHSVLSLRYFLQLHCLGIQVQHSSAIAAAVQRELWACSNKHMSMFSFTSSMSAFSLEFGSSARSLLDLYGKSPAIWDVGDKFTLSQICRTTDPRLLKSLRRVCDKSTTYRNNGVWHWTLFKFSVS